MTELLLQATGVSKRFGGVLANDDVSLDVAPGDVVGLIGPNGAGKTTFFDMLCGVKPSGAKVGPDSGTVTFRERDITRMRSHQICSLGIGRAFQIVRVFDGIDVLGNVAVGALMRTRSLVEAEERAAEVISLVGLDGRDRTMASDLTLAERKRLEMARALATGPELLMLDEVMAGLTPREMREAVQIIQGINASGITVVLVEHVLEAVMSLCNRVVVLHQGRKIAEGPPHEVVEDQNVIEAYLGVSHE
jgi:branched-chain amino acid transport system ATP-binding protein